MGRTIGLAVLCAGWVWGQQAAEVTLLTHATVIDGTGAAAVADMTVAMEGGRITGLYRTGSRPSPAGAKVEDLAGKWVIPGLIDAHVHIADDQGDVERFRGLLSKLLLSGVTGVRDMAGDARVLGYLAREARLDAPGWPNIYYSALMAGPTFFYEDARVAGASKGVLVGSAPWMRAVDETTDIRLAVAEAKGTGATGVKLYANLPASLVAAVVAEAHRQGLMVWAHATVFPARPSEVVKAGVDVVSHTPYLVWEGMENVPPDYRQRAYGDFAGVKASNARITALIGEMRERGTILDATLRVFAQQVARSEENAGKGVGPWMYQVTRAAHLAGAKVDAGTDSQGMATKGAAVVEEMELLVRECGFTAAEAIQAATQVSAMAVGQGAYRGAIAKGMAADVVVLSADPMADVGNVRKVVEVFKDGKAFRADGRRD
jgi:imidazolonepropionase-like amidohydrolase